MDFSKWVDINTTKAIICAIMLGISAASVRAIQQREKARPFIARVLVGAICAGAVAYICRDMKLPTFIGGVVDWAAGWFGAEFGALLAKIGRSKAEDALGKSDDDEQDKSSS